MRQLVFVGVFVMAIAFVEVECDQSNRFKRQAPIDNNAINATGRIEEQSLDSLLDNLATEGVTGVDVPQSTSSGPPKSAPPPVRPPSGPPPGIGPPPGFSPPAASTEVQVRAQCNIYKSFAVTQRRFHFSFVRCPMAGLGNA